MTSQTTAQTVYAWEFSKGDTITVSVEGFDNPIRARVYDADRYYVLAKRTINGIEYRIISPLTGGIGRWASDQEWRVLNTFESTRVKSKPLTQQQRDDIDAQVLQWGNNKIRRGTGDFWPRDAVAYFCDSYHARLAHWAHFGDEGDLHADKRRENAVRASIRRIHRQGIWAKDEYGYTSPE